MGREAYLRKGKQEFWLGAAGFVLPSGENGGDGDIDRIIAELDVCINDCKSRFSQWLAYMPKNINDLNLITEDFEEAFADLEENIQKRTLWFFIKSHVEDDGYKFVVE